MESNQASAKVSNQQLQAKKYIEDNGLEKVVSEMLNSLVHEKAKYPVVYMIKYLAGLLSEEERKQHGLVIPEPYPKGKPIVKFPNLERSDSLLKKYLNKNLWGNIKYLKTKYGGTIMNVVKLSEVVPESKIGLTLTDGNCITTFNTLITPIIAELHGYETDKNSDSNDQYRPKNEYRIHNNLASSENFPFQERICESINCIRMIYSRNLQDFPFSSIISSEKKQQVESTILNAIKSMQTEKVLKEGNYLNYKENENEIKNILKEFEYDDNIIKHAELNFSLTDNRGVFISEDHEVLILVNFVDHFEMRLNNNKNPNLIQIYNYSSQLLKSFEKYLNFEFDRFYGYVTSDLSLLGAGMSIHTELNMNLFLKFPEVSKIIEKMNFVKFNVEERLLKLHSKYKLSFCTDIEYLEDFYSKICALVNLDKDVDRVENLNFGKLNLDANADPSIKRAYDSVYEIYKYIVAPSGLNLNTLLKCYSEDPTSPFGILFSESSEYITFEKFIKEFVNYSQNFDINENDHINKPDEPKNFKEMKSTGVKLVSTNVTLIRNLSGFPFATSKYNLNEKVEESILKTLDSLSMKNYVGKYVSMDDEDINKIISDNDLTIFHKEELIKYGLHTSYPKNRGIIVFEQDNIFAVVNDLDHIKFQIQIKDDQLESRYMQILKLSNEFSKHLKFIYDNKFGFLTACPRFLGTGLIIKSILKLPVVAKNENLMNSILKETEFTYKLIDEAEGKIELTNKFTIGRSETVLFNNLIIAINSLVEKDV